jgi:hypothetical protein
MAAFGIVILVAAPVLHRKAIGNFGRKNFEQTYGAIGLLRDGSGRWDTQLSRFGNVN